MDPVVEPEHTETPPDMSRQESAREYESIHNRLFLIRIILTGVLVVTYLLCGASVRLAEGLRGSIDQWWIVNGLYVLITMFGFSAFLFPLSLYGDYCLEHHYDLSHQGLGSWLWDYRPEHYSNDCR